jgi:hypothetical protein
MIKLIDGFTGVSDTDVLARGTNVLTKLTGNADLPAPPLDLATLKAALDAFSAVITAALDGGKTAIAEKRKQRIVVIKILRLLGRYVELVGNDDIAIFETSGFQAAPTAKRKRDSAQHEVLSSRPHLFQKERNKYRSGRVRGGRGRTTRG